MFPRKNRFSFDYKAGGSSEPKSNSFQQPKQHKKFDNFKVQEPEYVKSYVCPKCGNFYDFQLSPNNAYVGRVPLLLSCKHTLCEECVLTSVLKQNLECVECNAVTHFDTEVSKRKLQDIFPVNFYVFGMVLYYRRAKVGMPNLSFRPIATENKKTNHYSNATGSLICSQIKCAKIANLKCLSCDEIFCDDCVSSTHDPSTVPSKHDFIMWGQVTPELRQLCATHRSNVLEFACRSCNVNLCCYCVLLSHKDHDYYQLTEMTDEYVRKITNLVSEAENSLRYLKQTDKKITQYLKEITPESPQSNISGEISRHFENFHAKLQSLERKLYDELNEHNQSRQKTLLSIREKVNQNIVFISRLCRFAKQLLNKDDVKYNVQYIIENLTLVLKTKCHLLEQEVSHGIEFEYGNAISDIDDAYSIKCEKKNEFLLVNTEDLPEDYQLSDPCTTDTSANQSNDTSLTNDDIADEEISNGNLQNWLDGMVSCNQTSSVKSEESASSEHTFDKKSDNCGMKLSWADECSFMEEEMKKGKKSPSISYESLPELETGNKQRVTVTHINSPSSFYVHLAKSANVSAELSKAIAKYAMGTCMKVEPQIKGIYLVKFHDGSSTQWYRGRVTDLNRATNKYTIFFIDYGNTSVVSKNWIRNSPLQLTKIPPLAIECRIVDVTFSGTSWDKNALSTMADIVNKESLLMVIVEKSLTTMNVDLITLDGLTSVRDALIWSGAAIPLSTSNNLVIDTKKEMASFTTKKDMHKFSRKFVEKEIVNVIITYAENPLKVHLILVESQRILNDMKSTMHKHYNGTKKGLVYTLEFGMHVAVYYAFHLSPRWFRARVIEVPKTKGLVEVKLIDVGLTTKVQWENVRRLDDKFYAIESLSFCVEMIDVEPPDGKADWPLNIGEFFKPYIHEEIVLEMLVGSAQNPLAVVLIQKKESKRSCLNGLLVFKNYAVAVGEMAINVNWEQPKLNFTVEMMKTIQSLDSIHDDSWDDFSGIQKEVEIVSAENPSLIYVKFLDVKQKYDEVYKQMQTCYASNVFVPQEWSPKQVVVVKYHNEYLRGIIKEEISSGLYLVSLNDLRKEIAAKAGDIAPLHPTFTKCPELLTRCHLANIIPAGGSDKWTAIACELLQETLKDKPKVFLTKCGMIDTTRQSLPVLLCYKQFIPGGPLEQSKHILCSITKILLKNGLALKANVKSLQEEFVRQNSIEKKFWDWLPPTLITDDHIMAIPTCVNDHGYIYIHDKRDDKVLEDMAAKLLQHFEKSTVDNKFEDWHVGDICVAKYFLDKQWYRAKVVGINESTINVIMVDYGNEEDLQPDELRKEVLFENVPIFASVVYLQDIKPLHGVWDTVDLDILHGSVVDKEVDVYFINGHNIHEPSPVCMSFNNISINEFLLTKCQHLKNSIEENKMVIDTDVNKIVTKKLECSVSDFESDGNSDVLILDDEKSDILSNDTIVNYRIETLPSDKDIEIVIINLLHYNVIVFELTNYENANNDAFDKMQEDIQLKAPDLPTYVNPQLDAPCIVKYNQDNSYYRAKILGIRKNEVLVWFVDYGNFEFIPKTELKEMQATWLEYPVQHHIAEIEGIELVEATKENIIKEHLASFYSSKLITSVVSQDPLKVKLYDIESHKLIYQEFIDDGTLRSIGN